MSEQSQATDVGDTSTVERQERSFLRPHPSILGSGAQHGDPRSKSASINSNELQTDVCYFIK